MPTVHPGLAGGWEMTALRLRDLQHARGGGTLSERESSPGCSMFGLGGGRALLPVSALCALGMGAGVVSCWFGCLFWGSLVHTASASLITSLRYTAVTRGVPMVGRVLW